ncbi:MAG: alpha/beta fold hydrolase [Anaerolineae bacterium]|nr:alpha/beta fold hydrolase [Anaerolineae bacterium]
MSYLTVAGETVDYVHRQSRTTARPALVFIHGAGGSHQLWLYQVRGLLKVTSYALDLPGHGRSTGQGRDSIAAYADWLIEFLDAAGLERVTLVGHSMGGAIALDAALRYPERVSGLGLVATGARLRVAPAILDGLRHDLAATVRLIARWCYSAQVPPEMIQMGEQQMAATSPDVLYSDFAACDAFDVTGRLCEIVAPTAILCGAEDRMTPPKYAAYLRDKIPGAVLHLVEGAGHMVMLEKPEEVTAILAARHDLARRRAAQATA